MTTDFGYHVSFWQSIEAGAEDVAPNHAARRKHIRPYS
jgi:hypothetical protein